MAKILTSKLGERILRGTVEMRSAATGRGLSAGQAEHKQRFGADRALDDAKVVQLDTAVAAPDVPCANAEQQPVRKKHKFQLRVDERTRRFINELTFRLDAKDMSGLVRAAVRTYEVTWYEHEGNFTLPPADAVAAVGANDVSTVTDEDNTRNVQASSKSKSDERLQVVLFDSTMQRIDRLRQLTGAASRADVVRFALCVLDAKLAEDEAIVAVGEARVAAEGSPDV